METVRRGTRLVVTLAIVAGFVALVWTLADVVGAWDVVQAQLQARAAEARAAELTAQAQKLREQQAMVQTGVMALASLKDSALVTLTYIGGGVALLVAVVVIGVLLYERGGRRRADEQQDY